MSSDCCACLSKQSQEPAIRSESLECFRIEGVLKVRKQITLLMRVPGAWTFVLRYNRQKQAIGDETDDTFVKPQAVDDIPFVWSQGGRNCVWKTAEACRSMKRPTWRLESFGTSFVQRTPTRGSLLLLAELRAMPSCNREPSVAF